MFSTTYLLLRAATCLWDPSAILANIRRMGQHGAVTFWRAMTGRNA